MSLEITFIIIFVIALTYREIKKHQHKFLYQAVMALLTSKKSEQTKNAPSVVINHSKAQKTASQTIEFVYAFQNTQYEMVLPASKEKLKWTKCIAVLDDDNRSERDVTQIVKTKAGPYKNFFGAKLQASQIIRDAIELKFLNKNGDLVMVF